MALGGRGLSRAPRLLENGHDSCVEQGYLLLAAARQCLFQADVDGAHAAFARAAEIGDQFRDGDLIALARMGLGRAAIQAAKPAEGMALLDEVMVAVTADKVSPIIVGIVYCSTIDACHEVFDLRRAQEWTEALDRWCASQPDLVPHR